MAELKTRPSGASVDKFLKSIKDEKKRADSFEVLKMMKSVTKMEPKMWGPSIVGFGSYTYKYKGGRNLDWFFTGFSPRKGSLTLYLIGGFEPPADLMKKLGKYKTATSCLYIKKLEDVDMAVLKDLIKSSVEGMKKRLGQ